MSGNEEVESGDERNMQGCWDKWNGKLPKEKEKAGVIAVGSLTCAGTCRCVVQHTQKRNHFLSPRRIGSLIIHNDTFF